MGGRKGSPVPGPVNPASPLHLGLPLPQAREGGWGEELVGAVSALPAFPAAARSPGLQGWVTVGAGSDVGAGLAEARGRGSVPQPPAELGTLGSQPQAQVLSSAWPAHFP